MEKRLLYCICPQCTLKRERTSEGFTIIKKGYERNGLARFFCRGCGAWFNERTGEAMKWMERWKFITILFC